MTTLTIVEAPAAELLRDCGDADHHHMFKAMTEAYFAAYATGNSEAIALMIDFYGGPGTYASWPPRVRAYAVETTSVNIRDWASAGDWPLTHKALSTLAVPSLVMWGGKSHPAVQRANALLSHAVPGATSMVIDGTAHFMIASHADSVANAITRRVPRRSSY